MAEIWLIKLICVWLFTEGVEASKAYSITAGSIGGRRDIKEVIVALHLAIH